jgi:hypothetical protein
MAAPEFVTDSTLSRSRPAVAPTSWRGHGWLAAAVLIGIAALFAFTTLPSGLFLPALAVLLTGCGFAIAAILYLAASRIGDRRGVGWEVAGALVFLGIAAALLSDSEQALAVLDQLGA